MSHFKKIALAGVISSITLGLAEAHVSYNTGPQNADGTFPRENGTWTGGAPTNYSGRLQADWVAFLHNASGSYEASTTGAIDAGAPGDFVLSANEKRWNPASSWGAALDFGLIELHSSGNLLVTVEADNSNFTSAFTLFSGWDTGTGNKHAAWNADPVNPGTLSATGLTYVGHAASDSAGGTASYLFENLAAGEYSLWIGGNGTEGIMEAYKVSLATSPVPIPGAVWLLSSAMVGLLGGRRLGNKKSDG